MEYLALQHHLLGPHNYSQTLARVKEIYFELYKGDWYPRISSIAEILDEENMLIIQNFCNDMGYDYNESNEMEKMYVEDISCVLDDCVEMILMNLGFIYTGSPLSLCMSAYPEDQVVLVPEMVPKFLRII